MEAGFDHVLFTTDKQLENELVYGTLNLITDPTFDPHKNSRTYGTVLALPRGFSDKIISGPIAPYTRMYDIVPEIEMGDRIYFHFNILAYEDAEIARTGEDEPIYPISYDQIYCAVRKEHFRTVKNEDGIVVDHEYTEKIIPIAGWTLIEPIPFEDTGTILHGKPPKYFPRIGKMAHIGTPLKGHESAQPITPGQYVLVRKLADRVITVEDKEYYITHQKNIFGSGSLTLLKNVVKNEKS